MSDMKEASPSLVDERRLNKAMEFFLWEVFPIRVYLQRLNNIILMLARKLKVAPISAIDMVSPNLQDEAKEAYLVLLREEEKGNPKVEKYWMHPRWNTFQIQSFGRRLEESKKGNIQFVIWIDAANESLRTEILDKLETEFPELLE